MRAADLTKDDIGAAIGLPVGDHIVTGRLKSISWPAGMVRLLLADIPEEDDETAITVPRDKNLELSAEHLRFRAVTEPDTEQRGKYLHELNHIGALRLLNDVLNEGND